MSQRDAHEELVERMAIDIGYGLHCGEGSPTLHSDIARSILAIVAEAVKEPNDAMVRASCSTSDHDTSPCNCELPCEMERKAISRAIAASPLTPGDGG